MLTAKFLCFLSPDFIQFWRSGSHIQGTRKVLSPANILQINAVKSTNEA
jgi:hypothetical protein